MPPQTEPAPSEPAPSALDNGQVSFAIFELARAHRGFAASLLRRLDLYPGQELILMQLHQRDGQTQSELISSVGVDHSTMSKALRRMQESGLLRRDPAAHDRRASVIHLTEKGEAMRGPIAAMWQELDEVSTRNLKPQQAAALLRSARTIIDSINARSTPADPANGEHT